MADCESCKNYGYVAECVPCDNGSNFERIVQTNADRIREMDDSELAELLIRQHACDKCDFYGGGGKCNAPSGFVCTNGYAEALMMKWLQSEAETKGE